MKVKKIRRIIENGDGNITIVHSDGTFHYNEQDVTLKEWTNNFFCRFNIDEQSNWQRFVFWNWVLSLSFGLFFLIIGFEFTEIPFGERKVGGIWTVGMIRILYLIPILIITYFCIRLFYYFRYRDFFSKKFIHISVKNNQNIILKGDKNQIIHGFQNILPRHENQRIFENECKIDNETKLISENIFAIVFFSITFYSIYSSWGENSITETDPATSFYVKEEFLLKKSSSKLTESQKSDIKQKRLNNIAEYNESAPKWNKKYENEHISSYYFFSLGYLLPLVLGAACLIGIFITGIWVLFLAYLIFWPLGYSAIKLESVRELNKVLKKRYTYPLIVLAFVSSVIIHYILTEQVKSAVIFLLFPILAPLIAFMFDGGKKDGFVIFIKKYWKFLFSGNPIYISDVSIVNIVSMVVVPWWILLVNGWRLEFNQNYVMILISSIVILRLLYRLLSPYCLRYIKPGRYLNFFKNDAISILEIVKQNGLLLEFSSIGLKDNYRIVQAAVKNNGLSLQFASDELKNDKQIVIQAINHNPKAIEFASFELQNDPDIVEILNKG